MIMSTNNNIALINSFTDNSDRHHHNHDNDEIHIKKYPNKTFSDPLNMKLDKAQKLKNIGNNFQPNAAIIITPEIF